ncbi:Aggrecan core protein [Holothuria leucospilota]|uniref:Aggrecan core protein n=1 Tax=Holothuria leucospilota TaxID=206669 RepID=A0A9Q1BVR2_HOLLE|nr:Aggrecan core protein [Holothuria leucospilota]
MALKQRRDDKMWQECFSFNFIVIISGLLYLILFVTSKPVCYTRVALDERNLNIKRVNCDGNEPICKRFASRKDVNVGDLLNSPCRYPEDHPFTHEKDNEGITCSTTKLPIVDKGSFDCAPNTNISKGDACTLTCDWKFFAAYSSQVLCEAEITNQGVWSNGSFVCHECNEWIEWNGSEYKLTSTWQTWEQSRQLCERNSSHLVTIENEEKNQFVRKLVLHCNEFQPAWIGLNDLNTEGTWEWSDGTVSTYNGWEDGRPDGGDRHDCVYMYEDNLEWRDWDCSWDYPALCERKNSTFVDNNLKSF